MQTPLRKIRKIRGLSLEKLVLAVGSNTGNLSRIERGLQSPSRDIAAKLAAFYAPSIDERHVLYPERYADWTPPSNTAKSAAKSAVGAKK